MTEQGTPDLELSIQRVLGGPADEPGAIKVRLETNRGNIDGIFHPIEGGTGAVVTAGGAMGGIDGPADKLYAHLPEILGPAGVSVLRIEYRKPNDLEECVLDVLAGCSFLKGIGAEELVLMGHSFGGAVVIKAGEFLPSIKGVVSMSTQLHGTRQVENLRCPLLLVHGGADNVLDSEASEDVYRRANDPKQIALFADTGHSLFQSKNRIAVLLSEWIPARLRGDRMESGRREWLSDEDGNDQPVG